jgi:branched-chain amino acid transport system ATP-binding protein
MFPILKEKSSQHAKTLSGGQQQMLAMARTLVLQPEIVMVDEPSLGLAPQIVQQVFEIIKLFTENGITVILIEQNARKGLENSDWGCVLDLGRTLFEGPADTILTDPRIQELYLGKSKSASQGVVL